ncbi:NAD(P)-dependent alcohol dehydrogenase [Candidatus Bipolaricaulota bacterium]
MKAIVWTKYGSPNDVLELQDIDKPPVKDDEVLVRVHAAALYGGDSVSGVPYFMRMATGLLKPKNAVPGFDVAGHVEEVGKNVTQFQPSDEVFGAIASGACAEYACAAEDKFVLKPANLTFEQAAAVPTAALTALQALRDQGKVQPGQKVLIIGASGGVGTFAVQIAKSFGAEVTGVCSTRNIDLVRSIGADHIIDYTHEDFVRSGELYDLILDIAGNRSLSHLRRALNPMGILVLVGGKFDPWLKGMGRMVQALVLSPFISQMRWFVRVVNNEDLVIMKELIETGAIRPVIDRAYPLSATPEAVGYIEEGHARGKVIISVPQEGSSGHA